MLEGITIRNFKSIGEVTVDLSPVTVLIGRSGVGKSNFLRAIRFLRNFLQHGEKAIQSEGGWERIWPFGVAHPLFFSARFRLPGFEEIFAYQIGWDHQSRTPNVESLAIGGNAIFSRQGGSWPVWPGVEQPPKNVNQSYLNKFPTITEAVLSFTAWTSGIGWHDFPATVLSNAKGKVAELDVKGLGDTAENYVSIVRDLTQDLRDQRSRRQILARLRQVNETVRSIELDSVQNPQHVVVGHQVGKSHFALDLSQESDGFRRYYAHLLSLYQTPPKQVLMFEEPENGIYPGALHNLAEEFATAPQEGRGQTLITTQSPALLDGFSTDQIRVVELDPTTQQTLIGPLDPSQAETVRERLLEPGELLTVDAARIAPAAAHVGASHG